jgi:hypothetical protein
MCSINVETSELVAYALIGEIESLAYQIDDFVVTY